MTAALLGAAGQGSVLAQPAPAPGYELTDLGRLTVEHTGASSGTAERVGRLYADAADEVEARLGLPLPARPHAVVAPTDEAFARRYEALAGQPPGGHVLAVAFPGRDLIIIRESGIREGTEGGLRRTLQHELAHLALGRLEQQRAARLPRWLNEGLAEWAAGRTPSREEASALAGWARFGQLPELAEYAERFPDHGDRSARAYTISMAFVAWLDGEAGVPALVRELAASTDVDRAFEETVALSAHHAELQWRLELIEGYSVWHTLFFGFNVWGAIGLLALLASLRHIWVRRRLRRELLAAELAEEEAEEARRARRAAEAERQARRAAEDET